MIPFFPYNKRLLCKQSVDGAFTTDGGILLPGVPWPKMFMVVILRVGTGEENQYTGELEPMPFNPGDVIWVRDAVERFDYGGEEYLLIDVKHVVGYAEEQIKEDDDED